MPVLPQEPDLLRRCLDRLGWGPEKLAHEINLVAGPAAVSPKAPYGWLQGATPRGRIPQIAALVLGRALGEFVSSDLLWPAAMGRSRAAATSVHGLDLPWTAAGARACVMLLATPVMAGALPVDGGALIGPVVDWVTAPAALGPLRRDGESVGPPVLDVLAERIGQLRRLDDQAGGPLLLDWITQDLRWASALAYTCSYDQDDGTRLFRLISELGQLGGWLAADLDQRALGQRLLLIALHAAHAAADTLLAAHIVSCLSYLSLWAGCGEDALRLIRLARQGAGPRATGTVPALLASREARAHAVRGDQAACAQALAEAQDAFADRSAPPTPSWAYWVTDAVLSADAGRAWLEADRPDKAERQLQRGLDLFGSDQPRNRMLHLISLAQARLGQRDVDGAADAAHTALDLAPAVGSARARARLTGLSVALVGCDAPAARELADRLHDAIAA